MPKFTTPGRVKKAKSSIATPENAGLRIIFSTCSQDLKHKSGLFSLLAKRWARVNEEYKEWFATQQDFKLGSIRSCAVGSETWVVQGLCFDKQGKLDQKAFEGCVKKLMALAHYENASIHISDLLFEEVPEAEKLLTDQVPADGLLLYLYNDAKKEPMVAVAVASAPRVEEPKMTVKTKTAAKKSK